MSKPFPGMVVMALSLGYWPQGDPYPKQGAWVLSLLMSADSNLLVRDIPVVTDTQHDFYL